MSARCLAPTSAPQPLAHWHSSRSPRPQSTERLDQYHPSYHFPCVSLLFFPGSPTYHAFCTWNMHHRDSAAQVSYINILSLLIKCTLLILFHSKMPPSLKLLMATPPHTHTYTGPCPWHIFLSLRSTSEPSVALGQFQPLLRTHKIAHEHHL